MIADEKKVVFEKFMFNFDKRNTISISRNIRCFFSVLILKDKKDFCSYELYKTLLVFYTAAVLEAILNPALGKPSL